MKNAKKHISHPFMYGDFKEALKRLQQALGQEASYSLLLGESGTGKTTLLSALQAGLDRRRFQVVYLCHGQPTPSGLTRLLAESLHLPVRRTRMETSPLLVQTLRNLPARLLFMIDEAQELRDDTLHEIRLLAEAELAGPPLFSTILSAQPDFKNRLLSPRLFPLWRRISPSVVLTGLKREEVVPYLEHGLGKKPAERFSQEALFNLFEQARGIPALVKSFAAECVKAHPKGDITAEMAADVLERFYVR